MDSEHDIEIESTPDLTPDTEDFSIGVWMKTDSQAVQRDILSKRNSCGPTSFINFVLEAEGTVGVRIRSGNSYINNVDGETPVNDGAWHHVLVSRNANKTTLYVDAEVDDETIEDLGVTPICDSASVLIGEGPCAGYEAFLGSIDEVTWWKSALSDRAVRSIFAAGTAGMCKECGGRVAQTDLGDTMFLNDNISGTVNLWNCSEWDIAFNAETDCGWIDVHPDAGTIPADSTLQLTLLLDSTGLLPGIHGCPLEITYGENRQIDIGLSVQVQSPLEVMITDAPLAVRRGKNIRFKFAVANLTDERRGGQAWFDAHFEGRSYPGNPIEGPYRGFVTAGDTLHGFNYVLIPERMPVGGVYEICTVVGEEPGAWSQDCFEFSVLP